MAILPTKSSPSIYRSKDVSAAKDYLLPYCIGFVRSIILSFYQENATRKRSLHHIFRV
jgi:hypothetical protein